nr:hypothetical protein [Tanacetum cinerariifolium]
AFVSKIMRSSGGCSGGGGGVTRVEFSKSERDLSSSSSFIQDKGA